MEKKGVWEIRELELGENSYGERRAEANAFWFMLFDPLCVASSCSFVLNNQANPLPILTHGLCRKPRLVHDSYLAPSPEEDLMPLLRREAP